MGTANDFLRRAVRRARRGFRRAEQQMRKLPGLPPMKPEDMSSRHWDAYASAGENPRPFGGANLRMLYRRLDYKKMMDGSLTSESIIRLLIEVDRMLYADAGYLPSDIRVGICRKR